jgi:hypothetical protein
VKHRVGDAEVAVAERDGLAFGQAPGKPVHHPVERRVVVVAAAELGPLLRPAIELASKIVSGLAEIAEPQCLIIKPVDGGERGAHRAEQFGALFAREARRRKIVENAAVQPFHEIERRTDNLPIFAIAVGFGRRNGSPLQCREHAIFTVDRMRRRHQHIAGLLA